MPLLLAVATAIRVDGGWEISGHKIFGSLTPVWTYGGFHAAGQFRSHASPHRPRLREPRRSRGLGASKRALDMTLEQLPKRTSIALSHSMAHHPEVQHHVAEMRVGYDAAKALLERTCNDWASGVQHPDWPVRLVSTRHFVINQAVEIVDRALDLTGGGGAFKRNRMEQLFRDVRMGRFHPGNRLLAPEIIAKLSLGVDPDSPRRWG